MEVLDIYDINKNKTGRIVNRTSDMQLNQNEYYLCVRCWIIDDKKEILLIKRNLNKINGGLWENIGGCVKHNENSQDAIVREIREEIGIEIVSKDLRIIKSERGNDFFKDIYYAKTQVFINEMKFNLDEVIDAKLVSEQTLIDLIKESELNEWVISSVNDILEVLKRM